MGNMDLIMQHIRDKLVQWLTVDWWAIINLALDRY